MTYEMVNVLIEKSEADLKALWGQMAEVHKQRSALKEGTTFDEEKSVRWNREELDRRKRSLAGKYGSLQKKCNDVENKVREAIIQYLRDEWGFTEQVAIAVYGKAYEEGHSGGFYEILAEAQCFAEFADKVIDAYNS